MSTAVAAYLTMASEIPSAIQDYINANLRTYPLQDLGTITEKIVLLEYQILQSVDSTEQPLIETLVSNGKFLLVMPPLDGDTVVTFTKSAEVTIRTGTKSTHVRVSSPLSEDDSFEELSVETTGYLSRAFGRVLASDENEEPVCALWQPSSITGGAILTTIDFTQLAITANEQHRRSLLNRLVKFLNTLDSQTPDYEDEESPTSARSTTIPPKTFDRALLGLYLQHLDEGAISPSQARINAELPPTFHLDLSDQEWNDVLDALNDRGIWSDSRINTDDLKEAITNRNLASFARRLSNA